MKESSGAAISALQNYWHQIAFTESPDITVEMIPEALGEGEPFLLLGCIDEGLNLTRLFANHELVDGRPIREVRVPGSGILLSDATAQARLYRSVHGVTCHNNCDVVRLAAGGTSEDPDMDGFTFAQGKALQTGTPFLGHVSADKLMRPGNLHPATWVMMDFTRCRFKTPKTYIKDGRHDPYPPGFVVSARFTDVQQSLRMIIDLVMGRAGWGVEMFAIREQPFRIFWMVEDDAIYTEDYARAQLTSALATLDEEHAPHVRLCEPIHLD